MSNLYNSLFESTFGEVPGMRFVDARVPSYLTGSEKHEVLCVIWSIEIRYWLKVIRYLKEAAITGDLVEFGVSTGKSLNVICSYRDEVGLAANVYGLDSFEGLPSPSSSDPTDRGWTKGTYRNPYGETAKLCKLEQRPYLRLLKGWFVDTIPVLAQICDSVAFARIDCDLYEPSVECLTFLQEKITNGAVIYFDDWIHDENLGETKAFFEFAKQMKNVLEFKHYGYFGPGGAIVQVHRIGEASPPDMMHWLSSV